MIETKVCVVSSSYPDHIHTNKTIEELEQEYQIQHFKSAYSRLRCLDICWRRSEEESWLWHYILDRIDAMFPHDDYPHITFMFLRFGQPDAFGADQHPHLGGTFVFAGGAEYITPPRPTGKTALGGLALQFEATAEYRHGTSTKQAWICFDVEKLNRLSESLWAEAIEALRKKLAASPLKPYIVHVSFSTWWTAPRGKTSKAIPLWAAKDEASAEQEAEKYWLRRSL